MSPTSGCVPQPFQQRAAALVTRGYQIIPIPHGSKRPALAGWQKLVSTPEMVRAWASNGYADGNIGVLTRDTPGVDLDILDDAFAREMEVFVTSLVGDAPVRVGKAPKRLLLYCTDTPFTKRSSPFFVDGAGLKHRVEILADGQQFVAYGTHPDTGQPYEWISFEGEPVDLDPAALPTLSAEQADQIVAEFSRRAQARGWIQQGQASIGRAASTDDNPFFDQRPTLDLTAEQIDEALADMPDAELYDTWIHVGMALHHQFGGSEEGKDLWDRWSSSAPNYESDAIEERWRSFGHYHGTPVTFATVLKFAKEAREKKEAEARRQAYADLGAAITAADSLDVLLDEVAKRIADADLDPARREALANQLQARTKKLGCDIGKKQARAAVTPSPQAPLATDEDPELEVALARHVLDQHYAGGARLTRFGKLWWVFDGGGWMGEDDEVVGRNILETLLDLRKADDVRLKTLYARMDDSRGDRMNQLVETLAAVMAKLVAVRSELDPLNLRAYEASRVMNCDNTELWFDETGETQLCDHDPAHKLTAQLRCSYDPAATCPTWDAAIRRIFQKCREPEEMIRHFYEVMGYLLQPTREAAIWVLMKGPGGNGKSFLLGVISEIMGRTVLAKSINEIFTHALCGKLMLLDDDLKTGLLLPDDVLKKLSEDKLITVEPKFGKHFEIISRAVPVMLANSWPATVDLSEGLRRRAMVFELTHILTDDETDPAHRRIIRKQELSGVLNHLVAGFQRFLRRKSTFAPPDECLEAKERWLAASNATMHFVKTMIERTDQKADFVRVGELHNIYMRWMSQQEHNARPFGRNSFVQAMQGFGLEYVKRSVWGFSGIRLRPLEDTEFTEVEDDGLSDGL
jgi:P4 family phage/plasmid primase-like protien